MPSTRRVESSASCVVDVNEKVLALSAISRTRLRNTMLPAPQVTHQDWRISWGERRSITASTMNSVLDGCHGCTAIKSEVKRTDRTLSLRLPVHLCRSHAECDTSDAGFPDTCHVKSSFRFALLETNSWFTSATHSRVSCLLAFRT